MGKKSEKPESLFRIVGRRPDGSCVVLKGGLTAQEAAEWFMQCAEAEEFGMRTIENEQEWPPPDQPVNPP